jgi:predicted DNA-binding ArsR family transcriptional regulator
VNEHSILVKVLSTGNEPKVSKKTFDNIVSKLIENDQINQGYAGNQPRITLAILNILPYFETDKRIVGGEQKQCLIWSQVGIAKFL